jgi:hypothetical protein
MDAANDGLIFRPFGGILIRYDEREFERVALC